MLVVVLPSLAEVVPVVVVVFMASSRDGATSDSIFISVVL